MASPSSRFSVPSPKREGPRPPSDDYSTPRSSVDHQRPHLAFQGQQSSYRQGSSESSSRRPSNGSVRQSPTSMSGHSHRDSIGEGSREGNQRLPRIKTSNADGDDEKDGPRSAPVTGPLRPPSGSYGQNGPLRSSSSPDPWLSHSRSSSPSRSPTEYRPGLTGPNFQHQQHNGAGPSNLGPAYAQRPIQSANILIPPRSSSQTENSRPITPGSGQSHEYFDPASTPRNATESPPVVVVSTPKSGKRHDPAFCGQCGNVVHGQFVRAMGKVYHLDCFRCKVGSASDCTCLEADTQDCGKVVAQKFFPVEEAEGMYPLCERDYFARLDLICAKCDRALRSSYITACGKLTVLLKTSPNSQVTNTTSSTSHAQNVTCCLDPTILTTSTAPKSVSCSTSPEFSQLDGRLSLPLFDPVRC